MEKNKICIIGGSGFIGARLIKILQKKRILNIDLKKSNLLNNHDFKADIREYDSFNKMLHDIRALVLLAAEHKDNILPVDRYYETNLNGTINVIRAAEENKVNHIIFTSSVAVYDLDESFPDETSECHPFNDYGKSKFLAEMELIKWQKKDPQNRILHIIRPTVVFGEGNRGNFYNLINQVSKKRFMMIGNGENKKSIAYVGNLVEFIKSLLEDKTAGTFTFNYADEPNLNMNGLIKIIKNELNQKQIRFHIPYKIGLIIGKCFDLLVRLFGVKISISSIRIKKFCADTIFNTKKLKSKNFKPPYSLEDAIINTIKYDFPNR